MAIDQVDEETVLEIEGDLAHREEGEEVEISATGEMMILMIANDVDKMIRLTQKEGKETIEILLP
jgi:hypothetical protein